MWNLLPTGKSSIRIAGICLLLVVTTVWYIPTQKRFTCLMNNNLIRSEAVVHRHNVYGSPPFLPRFECRNVFIVTTENGGIGHRMSAVAMGLALASTSGAAVVLDESVWDTPRHQDATSYPYFRRLLALYRLPSAKEVGVLYGTDNQPTSMDSIAYGRLVGVRTSHVQEAQAAAERGCNQVMLLPTGHEKACRKPENGALDYCVLAGVPGAYNFAHSLMSPLFAEGHYAQLPLIYFREVVDSAVPTLAIAWYVRNDDIQLQSGDVFYWSTLVSNVMSALAGMPAHHFIVSQHSILPDDKAFGFLHGLLPNWKWTGLAGLPVDTAFYHLAAADVLVHSGSSFSLAAGLMASFDQVSVFPLPKESKMEWDAPYSTYWLNGSIPVRSGGEIDAESARKLRKLAKTRVNQKPAQWRLPVPAVFQ